MIDRGVKELKNGKIVRNTYKEDNITYDTKIQKEIYDYYKSSVYNDP